MKVEVKDAADNYTTVYTAVATIAACPNVLEIPVTGILGKISAVRLSIDQSLHHDYAEIDAVQLVGRP